MLKNFPGLRLTGRRKQEKCQQRKIKRNIRKKRRAKRKIVPLLDISPPKGTKQEKGGEVGKSGLIVVVLGFPRGRGSVRFSAHSHKGEKPDRLSNHSSYLWVLSIAKKN